MMNEKNNQTRKTHNRRIAWIAIAISAIIIAGATFVATQRMHKESDLRLYEVTVGEETPVEADTSGKYALEPDKVYVVRWDVPFLYCNENEKVNIDIDIDGDFLVEEGNESGIAIRIKDYHCDSTTYDENLNFVATSGNLGIEFCADKCKIRPYGFSPEIRDGQFVLCFYTSGNYVAYKHGGISGPDGKFDYTYRTNGSSTEEEVVTQPMTAEFTGYYYSPWGSSIEPPAPAPTAPTVVFSKKMLDEFRKSGIYYYYPEMSQSQTDDGSSIDKDEESGSAQHEHIDETVEPAQGEDAVDEPSYPDGL